MQCCEPRSWAEIEKEINTKISTNGSRIAGETEITNTDLTTLVIPTEAKYFYCYSATLSFLSHKYTLIPKTKKILTECRSINSFLFLLVTANKIHIFLAIFYMSNPPSSPVYCCLGAEGFVIHHIYVSPEQFENITEFGICTQSLGFGRTHGRGTINT